MKKAILYGPYDVRIEDLPDPVLGPDDVLVRLQVSSICYTDVKLYTGVHKPEYPIGFGHDAAGVVEAVGRNVTSFEPGDPVVARSRLGCGRCKMCLRGRNNLCVEHRNLFGGGKAAGWFGEYMMYPERSIIPIPPGVTLDDAATEEPLHTAIQAHHLLQYEGGTSVVVVGSGSMGTGQIQVAKRLHNCTVIAVDVLPIRLELARRLGADYALNPKEEDVEARVLDICGECGPDVVIETAGTQEACDLAARLCGLGGKIGLIGAIGTISVREIINKEAQVTGIRGGRLGTREEALRHIADGKLDLKPAISHRFPLVEIRDALQFIVDHRDQVNKVVLDH